MLSHAVDHANPCRFTTCLQIHSHFISEPTSHPHEHFLAKMADSIARFMVKKEFATVEAGKDERTPLKRNREESNDISPPKSAVMRNGKRQGESNKREAKTGHQEDGSVTGKMKVAGGEGSKRAAKRGHQEDGSDTKKTKVADVVKGGDEGSKEGGEGSKGIAQASTAAAPTSTAPTPAASTAAAPTSAAPTPATPTDAKSTAAASTAAASSAASPTVVISGAVADPGGMSNALAALVGAEKLPGAEIDASSAFKPGALPSRLERMALKKKFERSLVPCKERFGRAPKCPESVALQIKSNKGDKFAYFFDLWIKCESDWGEVMVMETQIQMHTVRKGGKRKWMMEHEIRAKHPAVIADAILKTKKAQPDQWRANPDCPTEVAALQYWTIDEEGEEWDQTNIKKSETQLKVELSKQAAAAILPDRIGLDGGAAGARSTGEGSGSAQAPKEALLNGEADRERAARLEKEAKDNKKAEETAERAKRRKGEADQRKHDRDEFKNSLAGKAATWTSGLTKEIEKCKTHIKEMKSADHAPNVPAPKRAALAKVFQAELNAMQDLRKHLSDETDLATDIGSAANVLKGFKEQVVLWKKTTKLYE